MNFDSPITVIPPGSRTPVFSVDLQGNVYSAGQLNATTEFNDTIAGTLTVTGVSTFNGNVVTATGKTVGFGSQTYLVDDAAGVLALKNSTTAQTFRIYGTTTNSKFASITNNGTNSIYATSGGGAVLGASSGSIGFFGGASVGTVQTSGADLTNSVSVGGTSNVIADLTAASADTSAASLISTSNAVYQLARKLKQINDGLRAYGMFT